MAMSSLECLYLAPDLNIVLQSGLTLTSPCCMQRGGRGSHLQLRA